jgi:hypothetical protein
MGHRRSTSWKRVFAALHQKTAKTAENHEKAAKMAVFGEITQKISKNLLFFSKIRGKLYM